MTTPDHARLFLVVMGDRDPAGRMRVKHVAAADAWQHEVREELCLHGEVEGSAWRPVGAEEELHSAVEGGACWLRWVSEAATKRDVVGESVLWSEETVWEGRLQAIIVRRRGSRCASVKHLHSLLLQLFFVLLTLSKKLSLGLMLLALVLASVDRASAEGAKDGHEDSEAAETLGGESGIAQAMLDVHVDLVGPVGDAEEDPGVKGEAAEPPGDGDEHEPGAEADFLDPFRGAEGEHLDWYKLVVNFDEKGKWM